MPPTDFFIFLRTSLSCIADDVPDAHRALASAMGNSRARLVADGVARTIRFDGAGWTIYAEADTVDLEVAFGRGVVMDLIDGHLTMEDAIDRELLWMCGSVEALERFHGTLRIFLEGLIRAPGAAALLERYREGP